MSLLLTILAVAAIAWIVCAILKITLWVVLLAVCLVAVFHLVVRE